MKDSAQEARAQVRPLRASVLIGLGGTGKRILTEVRKRIIETYDSLDRLPIVGFLTIDTDQEKLILGEVDDLLQQKIAFSPSEEIHATVTGTHKLKSEIRSYPHIHEWIDPRILELGDVQFGAKGIRALGRLAFFLNYPRIRKAFNDLVNRVSDLGNIKYMAKTHGVQVEKGVNVFTVSSLCGGTGSGMFLDLAFMVKQELVGQEHTRLAYLVMPGIFGTDLTQATGYAALRELNHYSMFHDFEVRWEGDPKVTVLQPPPFDYCYLINNRNSKVTFSRPNDLFEMVGHDIFLEFAHEFGQYKASLKDNTGAQAASTDKLGAPLNYMSMGLASICFPRDRVISACAHRLAGASVDWWLSTPPDTDKVREYSAHFLDLERLSVDVDLQRKNQIKDALAQGEGARTLYSKVDEELAIWEKTAKSAEPEKIQPTLEKRDEAFLARLSDSDKDPSRWGEIPKAIAQNRERKLREAKEKISQEVSRLVGGSAPTGGSPSPGFARAFLGFLEAEMNHYEAYLRAKFDEVSKLEPTLESARKAALSKIKDRKGGLFDKKKGILEHLQGKVQPACDNYYKRRIDKKILELSLGFVGEVLDFLRDRIKNLDQFTNKLAQLRRTLSEAEKVLTFDTQGLNLNGELLYEPGEVQSYYDQFVTDGDRKSHKNTPSLVAVGVLSSLPASSLYELGSDSYRNKDIISHLVEKSRPFFSPLNEISVARKFLDRYPGEDQALLALRNIFNSSEVFLTFKQIPDFSVLPNSRVSLIGIFGGEEPTLPDYASLLPLLSKCGDGVAQLKGVQPIRGKHEILFTIEEGAFPLRRINEIDAYEAAYDRYMRSDNLNPLHLRKNEEDYLLEIGLPPLEEQRKARVACLAGIALGIIGKDEDDPRFLIYRYTDERTGLGKSRPVGRVGEEEKMAESLLSRFNKDLRELIYREVLAKLGRARGEGKEKEQIWRSLVQYREDLFARKPKDLADRYSSEVIEPLIEEYQLFDKSFMRS